MTEPEPDTDELPDDIVVEEDVPDPEGDQPDE